jgi:hypothetical protein
MINFKEFQFARILFVIAIPAQIFLAFMFVTEAGNHPMTIGSFAMANGVFLIIYLLFYGMKTTIDEKVILITYGIGLIRKTIRITDIKDVTIVSSPWYYGWGIRIIPNGMMYNINGPGAIELTFNDRSRIIRIGSANTLLLQEKIQSLLKV